MNTSTFFSHSFKDEAGNSIGTKTIQAHTLGVVEKANRALSETVRFDLLTIEELRELVQLICKAHDIGKYSSYFQHYLLGNPTDRELKTHARIGAHLALGWMKSRGRPDDIQVIAYAAILNHHTNLKSKDDRILQGDSEGEVLDGILQGQLKSLQAARPNIQHELQLGFDETPLSLLPVTELRRQVRRFFKSPRIEHYFLLNYVFSLLVEADKLDASDTQIHTYQQLPPDSVDQHLSSFSQSPTPLFALRQELRREVCQHLNAPDILSKKLMILTAPTGLGKTFTALDFALKLRNLILEKENRHAQLITALPFINIIEQTLSEYKKALQKATQSNTSIEILAHYQYADVFGEQSSESDEKGYSQKLMQLDTWQADIVITSYVQLLQTLITHKNKLLKKFNHLAGAIVIMDEVQSIRLEHMPLVGAMLYYLTKYLGTRLIMMTATQPKIFELADQHILGERNICSSDQLFPLVQNPQRYFQAFTRTQIVPVTKDLPLDEDSFLGILENYWSPNKSCLIVCNKVKRSLKLFEAITNWIGTKGYENEVFYLSTNVVPAHRMGIIGKVKKALEHSRIPQSTTPPPILIATQVVEAGVDLDFDMGFRDIGPVDSIIQVAGRINRENRESQALSPLYVVDFNDCKDVYGAVAYQQALHSLGQSPIPEPGYYDLVQTYFDGEGARKAFHQSKLLFRSIETLNYDGEKTDCPISSFQVIEQAKWVTNVFVEWDETASEALLAFLAIGKARKEDRTKAKHIFDTRHKLHFHQHIIALPKSLVSNTLTLINDQLPDLELYLLPKEQVLDLYHATTGFIRYSQTNNPQLNTISF